MHSTLTCWISLSCATAISMKLIGIWHGYCTCDKLTYLLLCTGQACGLRQPCWLYTCLSSAEHSKYVSCSHDSVARYISSRLWDDQQHGVNVCAPRCSQLVGDDVSTDSTHAGLGRLVCCWLSSPCSFTCTCVMKIGHFQNTLHILRHPGKF